MYNSLGSKSILKDSNIIKSLTKNYSNRKTIQKSFLYDESESSFNVPPLSPRMNLNLNDEKINFNLQKTSPDLKENKVNSLSTMSNIGISHVNISDFNEENTSTFIIDQFKNHCSSNDIEEQVNSNVFMSKPLEKKGKKEKKNERIILNSDNNFKNDLNEEFNRHQPICTYILKSSNQINPDNFNNLTNFPIENSINHRIDEQGSLKTNNDFYEYSRCDCKYKLQETLLGQDSLYSNYYYKKFWKFFNEVKEKFRESLEYDIKYLSSREEVIRYKNDKGQTFSRLLNCVIAKGANYISHDVLHILRAKNFMKELDNTCLNEHSLNCKENKIKTKKKNINN
jgi:hypothetical protein